MLQFDIRVTVRDPETRLAVEDYTEGDIILLGNELETTLDEQIYAKEDGEKVLITVARFELVK